MANPRGQQRAKPFREALQVEIAALSDDPKGLRGVAKKLIAKAYSGDVNAIKELADRLDGKVPQAVIGGEEDDPAIKLQHIERHIIRPEDTHGGDIPEAAKPSEI